MAEVHLLFVVKLLSHVLHELPLLVELRFFSYLFDPLLCLLLQVLFEHRTGLQDLVFVSVIGLHFCLIAHQFEIR